MEPIALPSVGSFSVAVLCLIISVHQILLQIRKPQISWPGWSAAVSFSGLIYAIGVFFEYNMPPGPWNRFAGLLEFTAIIFVIHCAYGFCFAVLGWRGRQYHAWAGLFHGLILILLWSGDWIVSHEFVSQNFVAMSRPYVEPGLGPLGPVFECYGITASVWLFILLARHKEPKLRNRRVILFGIAFWLALAAHDGLASMGMKTFQYVMEYGFLGFSVVVLWVVFNGFEDLSTLEKFRAIGEFANDIIVLIQDGKVVFANPAAAALFQWHQGEATIDAFSQMMAPEDRSRFAEHYRGLLDASGKAEFIMVRIRKPDGTEVIVDIRAKRVSYRSQPAILAIVRDATQRVRQEEGNYSAFFESMEDIIVVAKPDGTIIHTNSAARQKLGFQDDELTTMHVTDLCPEKWRPRAEARFADIPDNEHKVWTLPLLTKSQGTIPAEVRFWSAMWSGADCIFGIAKDLTAENDAKELLNRLFLNNPALMALFSMPEKRCIEANRAFLAMFGYAREEVIGKTGAELDLFLDPDAAGSIEEQIFTQGHLFNADVQAKKNGGTVFDCLLSAEIIRHGGRRLLLLVMIDISGQKEAERQLRQARNSLEERVQERTRAIEEMHSQMLIQEKLASIGQLAAGIAHELNNPINFIATNFGSLKEIFTDFAGILTAYKDFLKKLDPGKHHGSWKAVQKVEKAIDLDYLLGDIPVLFEETQRGFDRVDQIIRSMRQFSRMDQPNQFVVFDINKAVENTLVIARNTYKDCAEIFVESGDIPQIPCLPEQIHQVLLNLVVNSAQAIEAQLRKDKGKIRVRTYEEDNQVVCQVCDDGPGIEEDIRHRVFEAFFTTKPAGKGSGLGLSLSYDIVVNKHRGAMTVDCPDSGGTVFTFRIPGNLDKAAASTRPEPAPSPP